MGRGTLITVDGLDGCGKSTQAELLADYFMTKGFKVFHTSEPGGTPLGKELKTILHDQKSLSQKVRIGLLLACRASVSEAVEEKLSEGYIVVKDRGEASTAAYQLGLALIKGSEMYDEWKKQENCDSFSPMMKDAFFHALSKAGKELKVPVREILALNRLSKNGIISDLTIFFDIDPKEAYRRSLARDSNPSPYEQIPGYMANVAKAYQILGRVQEASILFDIGPVRTISMKNKDGSYRTSNEVFEDTLSLIRENIPHLIPDKERKREEKRSKLDMDRCS